MTQHIGARLRSVINNRPRLSLAVALVCLLMVLEDFYPRPIAAGVYYLGLGARWMSVIPYSQEASFQLFRFAGRRHYAPAQVAVSFAYRTGTGVQMDAVGRFAWVYGAYAQGYLPAYYHLSYFAQNAFWRTIDHHVQYEIERIQKMKQHVDGDIETLLVDAENEEIELNLNFGAILMSAALLGDPFAHRELTEALDYLQQPEVDEMERRAQAWLNDTSSVGLVSDDFCHWQINVQNVVAINRIEIARSCFHKWSRAPLSRRNWLQLITCIEDKHPPGMASPGIEAGQLLVHHCIAEVLGRDA